MFQISAETRKIGIWIYIFGSLAALSKLPDTGIDVAKVIPILPEFYRNNNAAGIIFYPLTYSFLAFLVSAASEYLSYKTKTIKEELDTTINSSELPSKMSPIRKKMVDAILVATVRMNWAVTVLSWIRNTIEILMPSAFGLICSILAYEDGIFYIKNVLRAIS